MGDALYGGRALLSVRLDSDEELDRYKNYLVEKIKIQDDYIVLEIRPWEFLQTDTCSHDEWYREHMKQFGRAPDYF